MVWAIVGVVVVLLVLAVVGISIMGNRQMREREERIKRKGERYLCWIASAPDSLYEPSNAPGYAEARVVFSTADDPDLKQRLKEAARRLRKGELVDEDVDVDKVEAFYEKYKDQKWMHEPLKLPKWLIGDFKAYTSPVQIWWRRLPERHLTHSYLYCWVLFGEDGGVEMEDYRDAEIDEEEEEE